MPEATAFDTLAAAEAMTDAGIEEPHAKAIAGVVRDGRAGLATRSDIRRLEDRMATKSDVAELRAEIASLETRLIARIYGGLIALGTAISALIVAAVAIIKFL